MLFPVNHALNIEKGLAHVIAHMKADEELVDVCLRHIGAKTGSIYGSKRHLKSYAEAKAIVAWFADHDLSKCKQFAYVVGKLERMLYQTHPTRGEWAPLVQRDAMLWPLLSDHPQLVAWFGAFDAIDLKQVSEVGSFAFETYQAKLALRGDWERLGEHSERYLTQVPKKEARFALDNRFYLALAKGDMAAMKKTLAEMVTRSEIQWRNADQGYTGLLIVSEAVIYAKIAWRHGYQVRVNTPWIPAEWLPIQPLDAYHDPYPFMQEFDIDTPLPDTSSLTA